MTFIHLSIKQVYWGDSKIATKYTEAASACSCFQHRFTAELSSNEPEQSSETQLIWNIISTGYRRCYIDIGKRGWDMEEENSCRRVAAAEKRVRNEGCRPPCLPLGARDLNPMWGSSTHRSRDQKSLCNTCWWESVGIHHAWETRSTPFHCEELWSWQLQPGDFMVQALTAGKATLSHLRPADESTG